MPMLSHPKMATYAKRLLPLVCRSLDEDVGGSVSSKSGQHRHFKENVMFLAITGVIGFSHPFPAFLSIPLCSLSCGHSSPGPPLTLSPFLMNFACGRIWKKNITFPSPIYRRSRSPSSFSKLSLQWCRIGSIMPRLK